MAKTQKQSQRSWDLRKSVLVDGNEESLLSARTLLCWPGIIPGLHKNRLFKSE